MNAKLIKLPKKRLRIGLDCDDVIFECVSIAIRLVNEQRAIQGKPPLEVGDVTAYGVTGTETDAILPYFSKKEFYQLQTAVPGAREMIRTLLAWGHDVFIVTSLPPEFAELRQAMLKAAFPELPEENIIFAKRKDLITVDVMLDDGPHHIVGKRKVSAKYPVLWRKPWNKSVVGIRSVQSFSEFLELVSSIADSSARIDKNGHKLVCLVGPSGSGKTELIKAILKNPFFGRVSIVTTDRNASDAYEKVDKATFDSLRVCGELIEHSVYNGYDYGIRISEIERLWREGKHAIACADLAGAFFPEKDLRRSERDLDLLQKRSS